MKKKIDLDKEISLIACELKEWRKQIHEEPELAMKEYKTSEFIFQKLSEMGIDEIKKIKDTGVIATIYGKDQNTGVALRADIDALPVNEENDGEVISKISGISHACGHDIHTISLLGAAKIFNKNKHFLLKSIRFLFQPAEESGEGAKYLIANGALQNIDLEAIFAIHCWPDVPAGKIFFREGKVCASSDKFEIIIHGVQAHAAHPHKSIDPIIIAGNVICAIQNIISREISPLESNVISLSTINGGVQENIISNRVEITGSIRALTPECREYIHRRLAEVVEKTAEIYRGKGEIIIKKGHPPLVNDPNISKIVEASLLKEFGTENFLYNPVPSMGSEDFSYYLEQVPGAMYRIGCGFENEKNYPLHSNKFKANDSAISTGIKSLMIPALEILL